MKPFLVSVVLIQRLSIRNVFFKKLTYYIFYHFTNLYLFKLNKQVYIVSIQCVCVYIYIYIYKTIFWILLWLQEKYIFSKYYIFFKSRPLKRRGQVILCISYKLCQLWFVTCVKTINCFGVLIHIYMDIFIYIL